MYPPVDAQPLTTRLQAIRKTTLAFASLFKDIPFIKYDDNGVELERIKVPIIYGDKEKYVKRLDISQEKVQITLPRIEYGLLNIQYDPSRRTNQANKITGCTSNGSAYVHSPMPYNFNFELVLYTRNIEDANQIMEYIIPFFIPDYNMRINMVPELGITKTIPVTLTGDSQEEDSSGVYDSSVRSVFRTLTFTARSYLYQPPQYYKPILETHTNLRIPQNSTTLQLANGYGSFSTGEIVYQGISYNRQTARANVIDWNANTNSLIVDNVKGVLKANTTIKNQVSSAQYTIQSINTSNIVYTADITPSPNTYPVTGPYTYNITITDNTL